MSDFNRYVTTQPGTPKQRSRFDISHRHLTTMNAGSLYPVARWEVLPSDTFTIDLATVLRMQTPMHPVMDNCYMDVFFFFVPNRLVWEHWKEFMGESRDGFLPATEYEEPHVYFPRSDVAVKKGSIYDKLGIPQGYISPTNDHGPSALSFRAYGLIWNDWFRDQNVSPEIFIDRSDSNYMIDFSYGDELEWFDEDAQFPDHNLTMVNTWMEGRPLPVAKYHDLFTSALPLPQRGPAVALPLESVYDEGLPVLAGDLLPGVSTTDPGDLEQKPLVFSSNGGTGTAAGAAALGTDNRSQLFTNRLVMTSTLADGLFPANLWAQSQFAAIGIENFRQAYALQRLYEREARSGSRYVELIRSAYGVVSPDARQQRPELLGLRRIPITMTQVVQHSATTETSPQGNTAAYSLTHDKSSYFTYSATEHGNIICVAAIHLSFRIAKHPLRSC